jgi:hypothetical protein
MRKWIWMLAMGLTLAIGVPSASADGFTPTFTCTSCGTIPTSADVSFPSPSVLEIWSGAGANVEDFITLASNDNPSDTYTWSNSIMPDVQVGLGDYILSITDITTGDMEAASGTVGVGDPLFTTSVIDYGTLVFTPIKPVPTPEPCTLGLILAGSLLLTRKRRA